MEVNISWLLANAPSLVTTEKLNYKPTISVLILMILAANCPWEITDFGVNVFMRSRLRHSLHHSLRHALVNVFTNVCPNGNVYLYTKHLRQQRETKRATWKKLPRLFVVIKSDYLFLKGIISLTLSNRSTYYAHCTTCRTSWPCRKC